jgi:hypothetical protein
MAISISAISKDITKKKTGHTSLVLKPSIGTSDEKKSRHRGGSPVQSVQKYPKSIKVPSWDSQTISGLR